MAGKFQGHSPYNYVLGNPISLVDPDGAAPEGPIYGSDGKLIGYMVEAGQGPTQIAQDLNENYDCQLQCEVNFQDVVLDNAGSFANVIDDSGAPLGKFDEAYKSGNIEPGDILLIDYGAQSEEAKQLILVKVEKLEKKRDSVQKRLDGDSITMQELTRQQQEDVYGAKGNAGGGRVVSGGAGAAYGSALRQVQVSSTMARGNRIVNEINAEIDSIKKEIENE